MALDNDFPKWLRGAPEAGTPAPPGVADALRSSISTATGVTVTFVDAPTIGDTFFGPNRLVFSLRSEGLPTEWLGRLVAFPTGPETAVLAHSYPLPCKVATVITDALEMPAHLGGSLTVAAIPTGKNFADLFDQDPDVAAPRLRQIASTHARLHSVDPGHFEGVPALDFDAMIAAFGDAVADQRATLSGIHPGPGAQVLCHGGLSPLTVHQDTADANALVFANWSGAVIGEPEFDLAWTLLGFWLAPMFAASRSERRALLLTRDELAKHYLSGYKSVAPVDADRVQFWQAYHCAVGQVVELRNPGSLPDGVDVSLAKRFAKLTR